MHSILQVWKPPLCLLHLCATKLQFTSLDKSESVHQSGGGGKMHSWRRNCGSGQLQQFARTTQKQVCASCNQTPSPTTTTTAGFTWLLHVRKHLMLKFIAIQIKTPRPTKRWSTVIMRTSLPCLAHVCHTSDIYSLHSYTLGCPKILLC